MTMNEKNEKPVFRVHIDLTGDDYVKRLVADVEKRVRDAVEERTAQLVAAVHASATRARELRTVLENIRSDSSCVHTAERADLALAGDDSLAGVPESAWKEPVDFMRARIFDLEKENAELRAAADDAEKRRQADNERNDLEGGKRASAWQAHHDRIKGAVENVVKHLRRIDRKATEDGFLDGASEPVCFVFEALPQYADRLEEAMTGKVTGKVTDAHEEPGHEVWQLACDKLARERNVAQENYAHTAAIRDAVRAAVNAYDMGPGGFGRLVDAFSAIRKAVA